MAIRNVAGAQNVNGLFTATGKKSVCGRRTGIRFNPSLMRPGSTRADTALSNSTSDAGARMKLGLPWSVKDIRADARETAQEAARRAGLPLADWLNTAILQRAAEQGIRSSPSRARHDSRTDEYSRLHSRLDDMGRRFEQAARIGPAPYARQERPHADTFTDAIDRLEYRLREITARLPDSTSVFTAQLPPNLDRAIAEVSLRKRALNGGYIYDNSEGALPDAAKAQPAPAPMPEQHIAGLDAQLRRISEELEAFRRPVIETAIEALRTELGAIGRTINEAMPRQAIESIETQVRQLSQRIADTHQSNGDRSDLEGIEQTLGDVRDMLQTLMPAENLLGYNEAIADLGRRLDLIVADRDPATLQQLDRSVAALREMSAHVASGEAVDCLATQVRTLADKVDRLAAGSGASGIPGNLQERIEVLTRALSERAQAETAVPSRLEALMRSLFDKIELLPKSPSNQVAINQLEDRIVKLMSRLDASESRLGQLDGIERGLTDLLVAIEDLRSKGSSPLRSEHPDVSSLRADIAQTQDSLAAIQGQLGGLTDRLSTIEKDTRGGHARPAELANEPQPVSASTGKLSEQPVPVDETPHAPISEAPLDEALRATVALLTPSTTATANQIWPVAQTTAASTDEPLEPGSGPPRPIESASSRIAASEAALGGARVNAAPSANKSNFIAAARRAAQAASQDSRARPRRAETVRAPVTPAQASHAKGLRLKPLVLAASVVAIVAGSIHYASHVFDFSIFEPKNTKVATISGSDNETTELSIPAAVNTAEDGPDEQSESTGGVTSTQPDSDATPSLLTPSVLPSLTPAPIPAAPPASGSAAPVLNQVPQNSLLAPPALNLTPPGAASSDVTGSVTRTPAASKRQTEPPQQAATPDNLPAGIAGPQLRSAALAGDAGAAYEIALRFVEARGAPANLEEAARWFERAARKGLAPAQFRYASMLEKGQGVKKDLMAAQRLYIAAAAKGHAKAMHNLAVLYAEGVDGKPDYINAAQWFRKAAELGVADSQYNLGVLQARGLGTQRNIAESYKWFALAAAQGDREAARKRDEVAAHLDAQALAAAQQAVKNFTPETQPPAAITVPSPPDGWDRATSLEKPRAAAPLSISALNSGKL